MGKTLLGGTEHTGNIDLLTPEQKSFLSQAMETAGGIIKPGEGGQFNETFQKSYVDPAQQVMQRKTIPGIKEQFLGLEESGSSALNQALAQSATDLSTQLGSQYMNQQQQALGTLGGMAGQKTFDPMIQEHKGILGEILALLGKVGSAFIPGGLT